MVIFLPRKKLFGKVNDEVLESRFRVLMNAGAAEHAGGGRVKSGMKYNAVGAKVIKYKTWM